MQIELKDVRKRFGETEVLRGLSLQIKSGQRVGLVGPNGSGKSTLVRLLLGLAKAEGSVRIAGRDPFSDHAELLPQIGYVPQTAPQLGAPVSEVVAAVCGLRGLPVSAVTSLCQELALDLAELRDRPLRNLSGGMKQKLLIALALASRAQLYVLDEPTASLDARSRDRFFRLYAEHAKDATLILCSHRLEEVRHLVDHVLVLAEGRASYFGPVGEFLGRRALSIIEVMVDSAAPAQILTELGFCEGARAVWTATVRHDDKLSVLASLSARLGRHLANLNVRELESLDAAELHAPQTPHMAAAPEVQQ
jgi:ABC-type multidrug transport system ATPase subunit